MTSLTKKPHPPIKKFFSSADKKTCRVFWCFDQVRTPYRSRDIPTQSHLRLGVFFSENPRKQPDAKVLNYNIHSTIFTQNIRWVTDWTPIADINHFAIFTILPCDCWKMHDANLQRGEKFTYRATDCSYQHILRHRKQSNVVFWVWLQLGSTDEIGSILLRLDTSWKVVSISHVFTIIYAVERKYKFESNFSSTKTVKNKACSNCTEIENI